jgi:hypothetical protein
MEQVLKCHSESPSLKALVSVRAFIVVCLAASLLLGCAPKPKILPEDRTPRKVLECALDNQFEFETLASLLNLKLKGEEGKFSGTVEFFYREPDTFVIYPRTFLGIGGFKAGGEGDSLTIYFPGRNEYYRGSFSDFEQSGLWSWGISLDMLLDLMLGESGLTAEEAQYAGSDQDLFSYKSEDTEWLREHWIDSRNCRLVRSLWMHSEGQGWYRMEYKDFTDYKTAELPREVRIEGDANDSAQLKFKERKFDISIPATRFQIDIPADAQRVVFEAG